VKSGDQSDFVPENIRPFLRWAGSKRRLLKHLIPFIPRTWNKYYEPFLGGGSMFFYIGPKRAEISDASLPLIETYHAVKRSPDAILSFLRGLEPNKTTFNRLRKYAPTGEVGQAGQIIFLNKACWNGLYRVNSDGIFNVPFGSPKTDFVINEENFLRCSAQLRRREISIKRQDFESIERRVEKNDFVFLDPPYVTSHNLNGFIDWNECLFSWEDQIRLASMARKLVKKGANVLITNAAHADIQELYTDFGQKKFSRYSTLASDTTRRRKTSEALFFGGPAYEGILALRKKGRGNRHDNREQRAGFRSVD
jgi:DNA adenine methylase